MASPTPVPAQTTTQTDASAADSPEGDLAATAEVPAQEIREVRNSPRRVNSSGHLFVQRQQPDDGTDSSYGDDNGSDLNYESVSSSIYNYRVENGRTYHAVRPFLIRVGGGSLITLLGE
jgi:hypothetical protein